ncbi:MAG: PQQ-dependent sugar dehydrogenase, partial [Pseudomonadales bacterium]
RVEIDGTEAREVERFEMGARIREQEQGPDGAIWILEDERNNSGGRLLKLTPKPKWTYAPNSFLLLLR